MSRSTIIPRLLLVAALSISAPLLAACGADDAVDGAQEALGDAADEAIASQLAGIIVDRTDLAPADADCVATEVVDDLGTATVVDLLIDTGGDVSQLSESDRQRVMDAARDAGQACGVEAGEVFQG